MVARISRHKKMRFLLCLLTALSMALIMRQVQAEIVVIGHNDIAVDSVTFEQVEKLWLRKLIRLPGTGKIKVVDQYTANKSYAAFYNKVIKKKPVQIKTYWAKVIFIGKAFPPAQLADDSSVVDWVANTPGSMGYVDGSAVNNSVKRLLTVK